MTPHNRALLSDLLDPSSTRCTDEVRGLLAEMANYWPQAKDGETVYPESECWHIDREGYAHCYKADGFEFRQGETFILSKNCLVAFKASSIYTTRAAAIAAQKDETP